VANWCLGNIAAGADELDLAVDLLAGLPMPPAGLAAEKRTVTYGFWLWHHAVVGDRSIEQTLADFDSIIEAMPDRFARASTCGFAATMAQVLGLWDEAERFARRVLEFDRSGDFAFWGGAAQMHLGSVLASEGRVSDAGAMFAEGWSKYDAIGARTGRAQFAATLAQQLIPTGRIDLARRYIDLAVEETERYGEGWSRPSVDLALARVCQAEGDVEAAAALVERALSTARRQGAMALVARISAEATAADIPHEEANDLVVGVHGRPLGMVLRPADS
jgi:tetratricopeptide (TPR) repeat protein